jgi:hypothetical protein
MTRLDPRQDGVDLYFEPEELEVVTALLEGLADRLAAADAASDDPVIERFTSAVSHGDEDVDVELRQLLREDLLGGRGARLRSVSSLFGSAEPARRGATERAVPLTWDTVLLSIQALNDVRLALGASIDIEALDRDAIPEDDPRQQPLHLMDGLAWLQGALIELLDS